MLTQSGKRTNARSLLRRLDQRFQIALDPDTLGKALRGAVMEGAWTTRHGGRLAVVLVVASGLFASAAQARTDTPSVRVEQAGAIEAAAVGDARELLVSTASNRARPVPLEGQSFAGRIYVFIPSDTAITQVRFFLDDPSMSGVPRRTDTADPWDFAGGTAAAATAFDVRTLAPGAHTITAAVERDRRNDPDRERVVHGDRRVGASGRQYPQRGRTRRRSTGRP